MIKYLPTFTENIFMKKHSLAEVVVRKVVRKYFFLKTRQ